MSAIGNAGSDASQIIPGNHAAVLTKSDSNDLATTSRALYIGGAGDINVIMAGGETVLFSAVPAGTVLPIAITRLKSTSTSATLVVAIW